MLGYHSLDGVVGKGDVIVAAREITPFALVNPPANIKGFVRELGGPTDHASILARAFRIPMAVGIGGLPKSSAGGLALLDGDAGRLVMPPPPELLEEHRRRPRAAAVEPPAASALGAAPAMTKDGRHVALLANLETSRGLATLSRHGAEGIGLFRSEFLFMHRAGPASEDEQCEEFLHAARALSPRPVTIRAADFGGDKMPSYLAHDGGPVGLANLRGIRFLLRHPEFFRTHLRAILRASLGGNLRLMFPLVPGLETFRLTKEFVRKVMAELSGEGIPFDKALPLGLMIEVPSAAMMAAALAREADFFSIGTNDLIQYTHGISRDDPFAADLDHSLSPSIVQLMQVVVTSAAKRKRPVSVCGELASQTWAIPLLVGLGVDSLSMAAPHIPEARQLIRGLSFARCQSLAQHALTMETPAEIRALLEC